MQKIVTFGEIMLRLSAPNYLRLVQSNQLDVSYAGSEANVAVSLAHYGMQVDYITCLPNNPVADRCIMELQGHKVNVDSIIRCGKRMGVMYLETGSNDRTSKVYYDREHSSVADIDANQYDWARLFKDANWFHWSGITPALSENAAKACADAIKVANDNEIKLSCDLNYRSNLWKYGKSPKEVLPVMCKTCDLIIGSNDDFNEIFGSTINTDNSISFFNLFPKASRIVLISRDTLNSNKCRWFSEVFTRDSYLKSKEYEITDIVDSIGAGDAFVGAYIYAINSNFSEQQALEFATAAGCLKHTIHGDYNWVEIEEIENVMNNNKTMLKR